MPFHRHSLVTRRRLRENGEPPIVPRERPRINNHTPNSSPMPTDPLSRTVHNDIGTVFDGISQVPAHTESVVYDQGDAVRVSDFGDGFEVGDVVFWVSDCFEVDGFGFVVDEGNEVFGAVAFNETDFDAETGEDDFELSVFNMLMISFWLKNSSASSFAPTPHPTRNL